MQKNCLVILWLLLVTLWVSSCSFDPIRDNPLDPKSPYFVKPPTNDPPQINLFYMISDCSNDPFELYCAVEFYCYASDPDENIDFNSVEIYLDSLQTEPLGIMSYDAEKQRFFLRKTQDDFPSRNLFALENDSVFAVVRDDSGEVVVSRITFIRPNTTPWPLVNRPLYDTVYTYYPTLGWRLWGQENDGHTFSIKIFRNQNALVWDTSGLSALDTSVVVGESLSVSITFPPRDYSWFLTVTDRLGNRRTAQPSFFKVFPPDSN